jgi:hypothetical protein
MSYGFYLFHVPAGIDPVEAYKTRLEREEADGMTGLGINPGPLDLDKERVKQQLAAGLIAQHPAFRPAVRDYAKIAKASSIDETEARRRNRHLELTDGELGLQVTLFDDTAAVAIPFWRSGKEKAENTLRVAWKCLKVLESQGNLSTYDTQVGKVLNLDGDFEMILSGYAGMIRTVDNTLRNPSEKPPKKQGGWPGLNRSTHN